MLTQTAEQLEAVGEAGLRSVRDIERLRTLSNQSGSLGLASIAHPIARLADQLDQIRKSAEADTAAAAETLLRAHYIVKLAAAHEVVAGATASMCR